MLPKGFVFANELSSPPPPARWMTAAQRRWTSAYAEKRWPVVFLAERWKTSTRAAARATPSSRAIVGSAIVGSATASTDLTPSAAPATIRAGDYSPRPLAMEPVELVLTKLVNPVSFTFHK